MFMVQLNQGTIFEHRDGLAIVGREAVLHVLIQIQRPEPSSMGGSLQEGKHVVTGGPENEFRRDGAVLVGAGQRLCLPLWGVPVGHNVTLVQVGLTANKCHFIFVP